MSLQNTQHWGSLKKVKKVLQHLLKSQEGVVFLLVVGSVLWFSLFLPHFLTVGNLLTLIRSVSILGMMALGMALVVISRGVDVSMIAVLVVSIAWAFVLSRSGIPFVMALTIGMAFAILVGALIGVLIAFGEVPPIFATLAAGSVVYGLGRTFLFTLEMQNVPPGNDWFSFIGEGRILGIPVTVVIFAIFCFLFHIVLSKTRFGWMVYAIGNNPLAARNSGIFVRPLTVAIYTVSSIVAFLSGLLLASSTSSINARLFNSTYIYDILLVVVLGGIGLNGGHGRIRNVILGTLLVGVLLNGMTIMNVNFTAQNLVKGVVLLFAITLDSLLNPRDEQTSQQGDL